MSLKVVSVMSNTRQILTVNISKQCQNCNHGVVSDIYDEYYCASETDKYILCCSYVDGLDVCPCFNSEDDSDEN